MTEQERTELQQQFCVKTVQDMSDEDRISFTYNVLMDSYTNNYTDEDFYAEVLQYFPELITIDVKS
tara:strand:- start:621 stop:818 length:198 start_codon:yes stop_codon:yes gene_type:complete